MVNVEILTGEFRTGDRLTLLPVDAASFSSTLNGAGEVTCSIPLRDKGVRTRRELRAQLEPQRTFLAAQVGESIAEAGPIVAHEYDDASGMLTVKATGMRGHMDARLLVDANAEDPQAETLTYANLSLGTIAKKIVERTLINPGGGLPIVLPEDVAGTAEYNFPGYEFATVGQRLDDLQGVINGPDTAFEPRQTADRTAVEWVMRVGYPLLSQTGSDWIWDTTRPGGGVGGLSVSIDASSRVNSVYVTGQGMDEATPVAHADSPDEWDRGYPLLGGAFSHSTVSRQSTLDAHAAAYLQQGSRPWTTWRLTVHRDTPPVLGTYRCGDWVTVHVGEGHPYLPARPYRSRISAISASADNPMVTLELRPTLENR